jgi:serine/threonine-protein kinase
VAVKVLRRELVQDPEMARRFMSEIKLARKVSHPNVCRIHDYGEDSGLLFISMEYIDGQGLKEHLQATPTVEQAFEIVLQIARGLSAVHGHGIIHRDFKASNIMLTRGGVVKLMDFGIAKDAFADTTGVTREGQVMGTPEYMSPEQAGGLKVDFRSDIYSLGCVVFEIFTGDAPFRGSSALATLYKHAQEEPRLDHPALPAALRPLLARALAKEPQERYASVADIAAALEAARDAIPPEQAGTVLPRPVPVPAPPTSTIDSSEPLLPRLPTPPGLTPRAPVPESPERVMGRGWRAHARELALLAVLALVAILVTRQPAPQADPPPAGASVSLAPRRAAPLRTPEPPPSTADSEPTPTAPERGAAPRPAAPTPEPTPLPALVPTPSPAPAATLPSPPAPPTTLSDFGSLKLVVSPASEVSVDGVPLGSLTLREIPLLPGRHVVRIVHPEYQPLQRVVTISAGIETPLVIDLREKGIPKPR